MNGLLDPQPRRFGQPCERTINLLPSNPPHPNRHRLTALELKAHADTLSTADERRADARELEVLALMAEYRFDR